MATGNAIQSATGAATLANPVTVAQGGTGQTTANAGFNALSPLTTAGDLIIENATPVAARLPVGTAGVQMLGVSSGLPAWVSALNLQATTGTGGYVLVNGTGNIITWTPPNDGALHRAAIFLMLIVGTGTTGGQISITFTDPAATLHSNFSMIGGTQAAGVIQASRMETYLVQANTAVTVSQSTAMTGGAATLWTEIWGC